MNAKKFACISVSISLLLLTSITVANSASSGVINFRGAIIKGGCTISNSQHTVDIGCYKNNGKIVHAISLITSANINFSSGKVSSIK